MSDEEEARASWGIGRDKLFEIAQDSPPVAWFEPVVVDVDDDHEVVKAAIAGGDIARTTRCFWSAFTL